MADRNAGHAAEMSTLAAGMSTAAAIAAVLAWLAAAKRAKAAPPGEIPEIPGIPEELVRLIIAIAASIDAIDQNTLAIIDAIKGLTLEGGLGWPPNAEGTRSFAILCPAVGTPYQASDMIIPDGMALLIKASPLNAVGSLIFVAKTPAECTNPNSAWPLIPNESIPYFVKNANAFYVSTNIAGSIAIFTAEQRS